MSRGPRHGRWRAHLAVYAALAALIPAWLLPRPALPQDDAVAARAARLSLAQGAVSVLPEGTTDWTAGLVNRPLSAGDQVWSDAGARAEIDFGNLMLRLAPGTAISLLTLSDQGVQVAVNAGTVQAAVHDTGASEWIEFDAPSAAMSPLSAGSYRISVGRDAGATVSVQAGRAQLASGAGESLILRDGQGAVFAADGTMDIAVPAADEFDRWCAARETQWQRDSEGPAYVSDEVPGSGQLSEAGQWNEAPDLGEVWFPTQVPADWAPYQNGQWLYVPAWGWTWMDLAPWGFAPFHYGRWTRIGGRWAWVPPPRHAHPAFAGALPGAPQNVIAARPVAAASARVTMPPPSARHPVLAMRTPAAQAAAMPQVLITPASRSVPLSSPSPLTRMPPAGPTIHARDVRPSAEVGNAEAGNADVDHGSAYAAAPTREREPRPALREAPAREPRLREAPAFMAAPPIPQTPPIPQAPPLPQQRRQAPPLPQAAPPIPRSTPRSLPRLHAEPGP